MDWSNGFVLVLLRTTSANVGLVPFMVIGLATIPFLPYFALAIGVRFQCGLLYSISALLSEHTSGPVIRYLREDSKLWLSSCLLKDVLSSLFVHVVYFIPSFLFPTSVRLESQHRLNSFHGVRFETIVGNFTWKLKVQWSGITIVPESYIAYTFVTLQNCHA